MTETQPKNAIVGIVRQSLEVQLEPLRADALAKAGGKDYPPFGGRSLVLAEGRPMPHTYHSLAHPPPHGWLREQQLGGAAAPG